MPMPVDVDGSKGGRRNRCLLLVASFAVLVTLNEIFRINRRGYPRPGASATARDALVASISLKDLASAATWTPDPEGSTAGREGGPSSPDGFDGARSEEEPSDVPIYVGDASRAFVASMDFRRLASAWDRDATYDDLLRRARESSSGDGRRSAPTTASDELRRKLGGGDVTVLFHTSPKTASSTLRAACLRVQYDACDLPRKPPGNKWPEGYRTPKGLTGLFGRCPDVRHFCQKEGIPPTGNYTRFYPTRHAFLHMFPFRNYDEWTASALHQISYRDGEVGCAAADELLDACLPHRYELDFGKYTKVFLAHFVGQYKRLRRRTREVTDDRHVLLLYDYRYLHRTLAWLGDEYGVPSLNGTDARVNSERPKESCKDEERMIGKFHDCFSGQLGEVHEDECIMKLFATRQRSIECGHKK